MTQSVYASLKYEVNEHGAYHVLFYVIGYKLEFIDTVLLGRYNINRWLCLCKISINSNIDTSLYFFIWRCVYGKC
jgi:hypothetical protein